MGLTTREVAQRFGVGIRTVQAWIGNGHLPAERLHTARGPVWLIEEAALLGFERPRAGRKKKEKGRGEQ